MKKTKTRRGFTIIEVSLVLAIAGIILTMAFIALPALQRQTRDAQRKEDTTKFVTALKKYQQNNRGALPATPNMDSTRRYMDWINSISRLVDWEEEAEDRDWPAWPKFYVDYLGNDFTNPEGEKYSFMVGVLNPYGESRYDGDFEDRWADWYIYIGATCENGAPVKSNNNRNAAVVVKLETNDTYCMNT